MAIDGSGGGGDVGSGGADNVGGKGDVGGAALADEGDTALADVGDAGNVGGKGDGGGAAPIRSGGLIVMPLICTLRLLKQTSVASFRSYYVMSHGCFLPCFLTLWFCFITTPLRSYYLVL